MNKITGPDSHIPIYIAIGLLVAAGGVLATPLAASPVVFLAFIATMLMLIKGWGTLARFGQQTLQARNVLLIAFGGWFFAEFLSTAINSQHWSNLDYPLRFMLGIGVFWVIRYAALRRPEIIYYGIAASALAAAAVGISQHFVQGIDRSFGWMNHPIYFGNVSILLGIYAAIVLITMRDKVTTRMRYALAWAIPLLIFATFLSGARSSWLGLLGLLVLIDWRQVNRTRLIGMGVVVITVLMLALIYIPGLYSNLRIDSAVDDFQEILNGDYRSSIGDRLQMWKAAFLMFLNSPLIGIGSGHYQAEMVNLVNSGAVDIELFEGYTIYNQSHSEMMDALATKGLVGLAAYLVLLILPFRFFQTLSATTIVEAKAFARMGQATIIAFLMFGLTLATFKIQIYCAVFPVMIAVFAAMALNLSDTQISAAEKV